MKEIEITISPVGDVKIKTKGFAGKSCKDATAEFEKQLGKVTSDKATEEAYRATGNQIVNKA